jgi:hypothetical protein
MDVVARCEAGNHEGVPSLPEGISWSVSRFLVGADGVRLTAWKGDRVAVVTLAPRGHEETDEQWIARVERELEARAYNPIEGAPGE